MAFHRPGFLRRGTDNVDSYAMETLSVVPESSGQKQTPSTKTNELLADEPDEFTIHEPLINETDLTKGAETATDLVTKVLHVEDDLTTKVLTFRTIFLGCGLSIFSSVLQEVFYFKPQQIYVSVVFLTVLSYILGDLMALAIPTKLDLRLAGLHITDKGFLQYLNPGPFNIKEHAAITIMASAACQISTATEALATQELYYGGYSNKPAGLFFILSSQVFGVGLAGLLREIIVHPVKMTWPPSLPVANLLQTIHRDRKETNRKLKIWYVIFFCVFLWEILPEYMFTTLIGVSVFCLAKQDSLSFTNIFGGASGNEGLGILSLSFDWNYIASVYSPFWLPLQTTVNMLIGTGLCYILFISLYYGNIWNAQSFPFLSSQLFNFTSNSTSFQVYHHSLILNNRLEIDYAALEREGVPWLTATYVAFLLTTNMGLTATIVYMLLWNWDDLKLAWNWANLANLQKLMSMDTWLFWKHQETAEERLHRKQSDPTLDPHYKLMLRNRYKEVPLWWWGTLLISCWIVAIACLYALKSTLTWWGLIIATSFTMLFVLIFGAQMGITGFQFIQQPAVHMLASYIFPGRPLANFYFTSFTVNTTFQAQYVAQDLRLAQYTHLPPRITLILQLAGTAIGAIFNWIMMTTIIHNQRKTLLSIQGTSIWSGQNIQGFNSAAISWSIAPYLFSIGARYQWVTIAFLVGIVFPLPTYIAYKVTGSKKWAYLNPGIILWFTGWLFVGINSYITTFLIVAFIFQFYIRKKHPDFFIRWNYLISAAFDGGTQLMVFILTFAVAGGNGKARPFPVWAGNPDLSTHNTDYCKVNPANSG